MGSCIFCTVGQIESSIPDNKRAISHITCSICGEYKVALSAGRLVANEYYEHKHLIAGEVYHRFHQNAEVLEIGTDFLRSFAYEEKDKNTHKMYKLAENYYRITRKGGGLGTEITENCLQMAYAKTVKEFSLLNEKLKGINVIDYEALDTQASNGQTKQLLRNLKMTTDAYGKFQEGIESEEQFRGEFMEHANDGKKIVIPNNTGNVNVIQGDNNVQSNTHHQLSDSTVIKELLMHDVPIETIDKIREEIRQLVEMQNTGNIDQPKVRGILTKMKQIGGSILLKAFSTILINTPAFVGVIEQVRSS